MSEAVVHVESGAVREAEAAPRGRTRTCVGCGEHVLMDEAADLVRLVLGPNGEIAVDARGGAFGRGAHVHARPVCLERAIRGGLARSTKGRALSVMDESGQAHPLRTDVLARAIQESMARRIEGLLTAAVRSRQLARGADAVTEACRRGEAELVVVACDAAAAAELTEVRRAVAEGRAVAWGDKRRLGQMVTLARPRTADEDDGAGTAVVAISSRPLAEALRQAVRIADACSGTPTASPPKQGGGQGRRGAREAGEGARTRGRQGAGVHGASRGQARTRDRQSAGVHGASRGHKDYRSDG